MTRRQTLTFPGVRLIESNETKRKTKPKTTPPPKKKEKTHRWYIARRRKAMSGFFHITVGSFPSIRATRSVMRSREPNTLMGCGGLSGIIAEVYWRPGHDG